VENSGGRPVLVGRQADGVSQDETNAVSALVLDAYRYARWTAEGCQHRLGCKCQVPFWLRPSSEAELERERLLYRAASGDRP
jgi:hypothetical protein